MADVPPLPVGANPTLKTAQDRLHKQLDSTVKRFHTQNDASEQLLEQQLKAEEQVFNAAAKQATQGLTGEAKKTVGEQFKRTRSGLHRRRSGVRKAFEQQNHVAEEGMKRGLHGVREQAKREGRLPTAQELQQFTAGTGAAPYINQLKPAELPKGYQGDMYCGPAVMAMIARSRGFGMELSDAQLVEQFARAGGTGTEGTSGNGLIAIGEQMGLQSRAAQGADFRFIDGELAQGRPVVALGDYYSLPPHTDPVQDSGHYILVQGRDPAGNYRVSDPMTAKVTVITPDTLRAFIQGNPTGGFAISFG